jgi:DNA-binding MarR family transcriptional regulator
MNLEQSIEPITSEQCAAELMEAIHPIVQFMRTEMRSQRESSLSVPQFRLLAFLSHHPKASLSEVAEHLGVTPATASAMTERLVQHDLVDRADHPQERRSIMLNLTESGSIRLEQMRDSTRRKMAHVLGELTVEELTKVSAVSTLLGQMFQNAHLLA